MEKKYYDLIITLIKQHKKFAEYEAILEDIANDVYEHSKVVLDSVSNEDVITAYLTKVISTSMITVPKKLNFNAKARHRIILPTLPEVPIQQTESQPIPEKEEQTVVSTKDVASNIIKQEELNLDDFIEEDSDEDELLATVTEDSDEDVVNKVDVADEDMLTFEPMVENSDKPEESFVEEIPVNTISDVDKNLVDMMINGVPDVEEENIKSELPEETEPLQEQENEVETIIETIDAIDSLEIEEPTDVVEEIESVEPIESIESIDAIESLEIEEPAEVVEEIEFVEPIESIDTIDSLEVEEQAEIIEEIESVEPIEDLPVEDISEKIEDAVSLELDNNSPYFEIEEIAESNDLELFGSENSVNLEETLNEDSVLETENKEETIELDSENVIEPCYDSFYFEPQQVELDKEEILSYLEDINEKHPEKRILEICDLKFGQKLSVSEIVEKTGFTQDEVLSILNEIVDTVKD